MEVLDRGGSLSPADEFDSRAEMTQHLVAYLRGNGISGERDLGRLYLDLQYLGLLKGGEVLMPPQLSSPAFRWSVLEEAECEGYKYIPPLVGIETPSGKLVTNLSPAECGMGGILIVAGGQVVERPVFANRLVLAAAGADSRSMNVHFSRLRMKIGKPENMPFVNVRKVGYKFDPKLAHCT